MGLLPGITENEALTGSEFLALIAATEQQQWLDMAFAAREAAAATVKTAPQPSKKEAVEAENLPSAPPADQADTPVPTPVATDDHEVAP
jgi:hypothetical protein